MKTTMEKIEVEIDGTLYEVSFTRETTFSKDADYGADADGNRGTSVVFIEEDRYEGLEAVEYVDEAGSPNRSINLKTADPVLVKKIEEAVMLWLAKNEPCEEEANGSEHDD